MTRHAMPVADPAHSLAEVMARGPSMSAMSAVTGSQAPPRLARVHFSDRRPLQLVYVQEGRTALAELHGAECVEEAQRLRESLGKSRRGFGAALDDGAVVADPGSGLVLRRPGLDARLPGLRLLHDPEAARAHLTGIEGQDPGPVMATLMAHRLGKRAVLRLTGQDGRSRYARLRTDKSGSGQIAYARHEALSDLLRDDPALAIPRPLGTEDETGVALFAELPGQAPEFAGCDGFRACRAIVAALGRLQGLSLRDLAVHDGAAEAQLLGGWIERLRQVFPERAETLSPAVDTVCAALGRAAAPLVPSHRDLHEKQILLDGPRAGFLDFDTLCLGHPAMDAGNLMAHLFLMGVTTGRRRTAFETAILGAMHHVPERQLRLWRRAALLRLSMIYAFSDMPRDLQSRLWSEALSDHD